MKEGSNNAYPYFLSNNYYTLADYDPKLVFMTRRNGVKTLLYICELQYLNTIVTLSRYFYNFNKNKYMKCYIIRYRSVNYLTEIIKVMLKHLMFYILCLILYLCTLLFPKQSFNNSKASVIHRCVDRIPSRGGIVT